MAKCDLAAVELDEVTDDGQAKPRAARLFVPLLADIEDDIPYLGREPGAIVLDDDLD